MRKGTKVAAAVMAGPLLATGVAGAATAIASVAGADIYGDYDGSGIAIRTSPHLSATVAGRGSSGQGVQAHCWKYGDYVTIPGSSAQTRAWDYHTNRTTGVLGFSSVAYLTYVSRAGLAQC
jgi:hypothetical protein